MTLVFKFVVFVLLVSLTLYFAWRIQRHERQQRLHTVWIWPALFTVLAVRAVIAELPKDPGLLPWLWAALPLGVVIGVLRGINFKLNVGDVPGTFRLMATPLTAALYLGALFVNEYEHVFRHGDPNLSRISCGLVVLTAGNSIAVNTVKVLRYRHMLAQRPLPPS